MRYNSDEIWAGAVQLIRNPQPGAYTFPLSSESGIQLVHLVSRVKKRFLITPVITGPLVILILEIKRLIM